MKKLLKILNQPYPINLQCPKIWRMISLISIFVFLFMVVFQPFGIAHNNQLYAYLVLAGYGGVTFVVLAMLTKLFPIVIPKIFDEKNWKVKNEIILLLTIIFFIGIGNLVYTKIIFNYPKDLLKGFLLFEMYTLAIGIIPIVTLVMISQITLLKKNLKSAAKVNEKITETVHVKNIEQKITITSDNKNEVLNLLPNDLLAVKSEGNYVDLFYKENSTVSKKLFRSSLKNMHEKFFANQPFFQCHRAYIVNINNIKKAEGNSQGFLLEIDGLEFKVPVSRSYVNKFKTIFN